MIIHPNRIFFFLKKIQSFFKLNPINSGRLGIADEIAVTESVRYLEVLSYIIINISYGSVMI